MQDLSCEDVTLEVKFGIFSGDSATPSGDSDDVVTCCRRNLDFDFDLDLNKWHLSSIYILLYRISFFLTSCLSP